MISAPRSRNGLTSRDGLIFGPLRAVTQCTFQRSATRYRQRVRSPE
jgi:hypothetical protein